MRQVLLKPTVGPLIVLLLFCAVFSLATHTFLAASNLSLVVQQSVIVGTLAIGQTMIILTAGVDLANGGIAVLGTIVAGRLVAEQQNPALFSLLFALILCTGFGMVAGLLVSRLTLPPFIVTLGLLGIITAITRLVAHGGAFPVTDDLLAWPGNAFAVGDASITYGMVIMFGLYLLVWYLLTQTAWGRHIYAIGNNREAARLVGIPVQSGCCRCIPLPVCSMASVLGWLWAGFRMPILTRCKTLISIASLRWLLVVPACLADAEVSG